VWQWEAVRGRADLSGARGETSRADSLLEAADRRDWPELERAAWLARRARLRLAIGDTAQAIEFARQTILRYGSLPPAWSVLPLLESLAASRHEPLSTADQLAAAEVEIFHPDRAAASRRLAALFARRTTPERWRVGLRLAEVSRMMNRDAAGLAAIEVATRLAPGDAERARCLLERARLHRDAGRADSSLAWYRRAARATPDSTLRETAWWEAGQEAEAADAWSRAREFYRAAAAIRGRREADSRLRIGVLWFAVGRRDSALEAWRPLATDAGRFWRALAIRADRRAESDSALATLAARPGYGFYRAAARDSLGTPAWTGPPAGDGCGFDTLDAGASATGWCAGPSFARELLALGARDDAMLVLARWSAGDPRAVGEGSIGPRPWEVLLSASRVAYEAGRIPSGVRFATLALEAASSDPDSIQSSLAPWSDPAGFDSLFATLPESGAPDSLDRAMMQALVWQESRFDSAARSRSNALGLTQLKLGTATDAARWSKEPRPTEESLRDPALNLRYGVAYLRRMLERFDRSRSAALAAYNAGPGAMPARWREFLERGGEALLTELLPYPETRDYVKNILGTRRAYRELRPSSLIAH
jgi:tetratricopeptide (TPR) repeat protein